ncbi:MAG TPA: DUF6113 family protein [Mycobacteriales bacterium]|nr:DUF6113 family protein [Mycobacteriales bacterium]
MSRSAVTRLVVLALLAYVSFLLAVFGAFLVPSTPVPGVSAGVLLAVVGNYVLGVAGRRAVDATVGAVLPALVWLVSALTLASGRREGDVVLTSSGGSMAFLLLGAMAYAVAIGRKPPRRADLASDSDSPE